jgi:hypothetical protein
MGADLAIDGVAGPSLPGMELQLIMGYLANFFVSSLRIGSFILSAPFFWGTVGAFKYPDHHVDLASHFDCDYHAFVAARNPWLTSINYHCDDRDKHRVMRRINLDDLFWCSFAGW